MAARNTFHTAIWATMALGLPLMATATQAAPPAIGSTYTFEDPIFNGTVFCDTLEQVYEIATADAPDEVYGFYRVTANEFDEPTCMAIVPTGVVLAVTPLGDMEKDGSRYDAWAIETDIDGTVVYALYLERVAGLSA